MNAATPCSSQDKLDEFIAIISSELEQRGYVIELHPHIAGAQALLYAWSPERVRLGFAKVENHFLFLHGDNTVLTRLNQLKAMYGRFSASVNRRFPTPHALRMQIPNLAIVAVAQADFPDEIRSFTRTTSLSPWYGGEVGQIILIEAEKKQITSLVYLGSGRFPKPGAFALAHASNMIRQICDQAFPQI